MYAEPYTLMPANGNNNQAVLLIHGFLATPYIMRSLAHFYQAQGFMARAILLPGHGTTPDALYHVRWQDWYQSVKDAIAALQAEAKEVHLCGFSLGGTLALLAALEGDIKSLTLIAPALGVDPLARFLPALTAWGRGRFLPMSATLSEKENLGMYTSFPLYGGAQVYLAVRALWAHCSRSIQLPPAFFVASEADRTVHIEATRRFFDTIHSKKAMRLYCASDEIMSPAFECINSTRFAPNLLAMSHVAMPVAPTDAYYGENGRYYGAQNATACFGEPGFADTHLRHMKRLTYNPDFSGMTAAIRKFMIETT